ITKKDCWDFCGGIWSVTNQFLLEKINDRLKSAMESDTPKQPVVQFEGSSPQPDAGDTEEIITSEEEYEGYYIIKAILTETIDPSRVIMRDAKSYCAILFDDNNRKPICRFYFNTKQKFIGVFDNETRTENKIPINNLNELFKMADHFKKVIAMYEPKNRRKLRSKFLF
ncbi:MAG: hypothetical protein WCH85_04365, partial [Methanomicrobiales archaeon]